MIATFRRILAAAAALMLVAPSMALAKRDLADLRKQGLIAFSGSPRTGSWKLKTKS